MKCLKCHSEIKDYKNSRFCHKCGYPLKAECFRGSHNPSTLKNFLYDAETGGLFINGNRYDAVTAFTLTHDGNECSLLVSLDECFVQRG